MWGWYTIAPIVGAILLTWLSIPSSSHKGDWLDGLPESQHVEDRRNEHQHGGWKAH